MSSASLVEGLEVERIRLLHAVDREPKNCNVVVVAALEVLRRSARVLVVVQKERYEPHHVQWHGRP